jgi:hypothetical protein
LLLDVLLDELHKPVNAKLRIAASEQMDMIRHDFQVFHLCLMLLTDLPDNVFSACFNCLHQHFLRYFGHQTTWEWQL